MKSRLSRGSWIITVPLVITAAVYFMLVFLPGRRTNRELHEQIAQREEVVAGTTRVTEALFQARRKLEAARDYNQARQRRLCSERDLPAIYAKIHTLATEGGAVLSRFDPQPVVAYQTVRRIPLQLACTGSFTHVCQLMRGLETMPVEVWVDNMRIEKMDAAGKDVQCELVVSIFADNLKNSDYVNSGN